MKKEIVLAIFLVLLGWFGNAVFMDIGLEKPIANFDTREVISPGDWIKEDQIHVYQNHIVLDIPNATWARFTDTNSMDPIIDEKSNAIEIIPESEDQLEIGDIVAYESEFASGVIIHRIIEKNEDVNGTYFLVKGDNNNDLDPGKIRFNQIKRVLVGIIY